MLTISNMPSYSNSPNIYIAVFPNINSARGSRQQMIRSTIDIHMFTHTVPNHNNLVA